MFLPEREEAQGGVAVAEAPVPTMVGIAPQIRSEAEGEATMVFLFPCSDYSMIRSNVSRFVESTFGISGPEATSDFAPIVPYEAQPASSEAVEEQIQNTE